MNCPCDKLFSLYKEMLDLHVGTKTNDIVFHKASEGFYETLFDVFHGIAEAMQDSKMASPMDAATARKRSYDIIMEAKSLVESMVNENKDVAVDNILRGLVEKLGFDCGTARGFSDGKTEEPKKEEPKEQLKEEPKDESTEEEEEDDSFDYMPEEGGYSYTKKPR